VSDYVVVVVEVMIDLSLHGHLLPLENHLPRGGLGTLFGLDNEGTGRDEAVVYRVSRSSVYLEA
jgi:hypothetical protein